MSKSSTFNLECVAFPHTTALVDVANVVMEKESKVFPELWGRGGVAAYIRAHQ